MVFDSMLRGCQKRFRSGSFMTAETAPPFPLTFAKFPSHKAKELKVMARWAGMNKDVAFAFWKETTVHNSKLARSAT